jgi:hypothetical protein
MAVALGALLVAGSLIVPAVASAASRQIAVVVPPSLPGVSGTFTVSVRINTDVDISGAQTTINFDNTRLQLTAAAAGDAVFGALINLPTTPARIATANGNGWVEQVAFNLTPPDAVPGDGTARTWFTLTFQVIACGPGTLSIPVTTDVILESVLLDGRAASYGERLPGLVTTNGDVTSPCPTPTPTPAPQTPTPPPASPPPGAAVTNVTGTVDPGFLGLTCPTALTIPLVRNATNTRDFVCTVFSNIVWNLTANDPKVVNKGRMTDGAKVLANPMEVSHQVDPLGGSLANPNVQVGAGANSTNVPLRLSQFVVPQDPPGAYGIEIHFAALSGF